MNIEIKRAMTNLGIRMAQDSENAVDLACVEMENGHKASTLYLVASAIPGRIARVVLDKLSKLEESSEE